MVEKSKLSEAWDKYQLPTCQSIMTPWPVILMFFVAGVVFLPMGVLLYLAYDGIVEVTARYDNICERSPNETCSKLSLHLEIPSDMEQPVYVYYRLQNYYQNHRGYVASRSDMQLSGDTGMFSTEPDVSTCEPLIKDSEGNVYLPCGLTAWSYFNDSFMLKEPGGALVPWTESGIAWPSDLRSKFSNPKFDADGTRVLKDGLVVRDLEAESFASWMRLAAFPTFRKFYRIIEQDLPAGTYTLLIDNLYPVESFDGEKYFILTTSSWIGSKNSFLAYCYMVLGGICILLSIGFCFAQLLIRPRKFADPKKLQY